MKITILKYFVFIFILYGIYFTGILVPNENDTNFIQLKSVLDNYDDVSIEPIFNDPSNDIIKKCTYCIVLYK